MQVLNLEIAEFGKDCDYVTGISEPDYICTTTTSRNPHGTVTYVCTFIRGTFPSELAER